MNCDTVHKKHVPRHHEKQTSREKQRGESVHLVHNRSRTRTRSARPAPTSNGTTPTTTTVTNGNGAFSRINTKRDKKPPPLQHRESSHRLGRPHAASSGSNSISLTSSNSLAPHRVSFVDDASVVQNSKSNSSSSAVFNGKPAASEPPRSASDDSSYTQLIFQRMISIQTQLAEQLYRTQLEVAALKATHENLSPRPSTQSVVNRNTFDRAGRAIYVPARSSRAASSHSVRVSQRSLPSTSRSRGAPQQHFHRQPPPSSPHRSSSRSHPIIRGRSAPPKQERRVERTRSATARVRFPATETSRSPQRKPSALNGSSNIYSDRVNRSLNLVKELEAAILQQRYEELHSLMGGGARSCGSKELNPSTFSAHKSILRGGSGRRASDHNIQSSAIYDTHNHPPPSPSLSSASTVPLDASRQTLTHFERHRMLEDLFRQEAEDSSLSSSSLDGTDDPPLRADSRRDEQENGHLIADSKQQSIQFSRSGASNGSIYGKTPKMQLARLGEEGERIEHFQQQQQQRMVEDKMIQSALKHDYHDNATRLLDTLNRLLSVNANHGM